MPSYASVLPPFQVFVMPPFRTHRCLGRVGAWTCAYRALQPPTHGSFTPGLSSSRQCGFRYWLAARSMNTTSRDRYPPSWSTSDSRIFILAIKTRSGAASLSEDPTRGTCRSLVYAPMLITDG